MKKNQLAAFDDEQVKRMSAVMGRNYNLGEMAKSTIDDNRDIPVISQRRQEYSGFHQVLVKQWYRIVSSLSAKKWSNPYR